MTSSARSGVAVAVAPPDEPAAAAVAASVMPSPPLRRSLTSLPAFFQPALTYSEKARQHHLAFLLGLYHNAVTLSGLPPVEEARHIYRHALARFTRTGVFHPPDMSGGSPFPHFDSFMLQVRRRRSSASSDQPLDDHLAGRGGAGGRGARRPARSSAAPLPQAMFMISHHGYDCVSWPAPTTPVARRPWPAGHVHDQPPRLRSHPGLPPRPQPGRRPQRHALRHRRQPPQLGAHHAQLHHAAAEAAAGGAARQRLCDHVRERQQRRHATVAAHAAAAAGANRGGWAGAGRCWVRGLRCAGWRPAGPRQAARAVHSWSAATSTLCVARARHDLLPGLTAACVGATRRYYPPADTLLLPPSNCAAQAPARTPASCNPQVPHNITAGGSLVRAKGQERIAYLAAVRNALIQPFYDECTAPAAPAGAAAASSAGADSSNGTTILELAPSVQTACFKPQAFLFVNDVYWCPVRAQHWWQLPAAAVALAGGWCCSTLQCIRASELPAHVQDLTWDLALLLQDDAVRLLLHDADMTCGLDVVRPRLRQRSCISCMRWQLHCGRP